MSENQNGNEKQKKKFMTSAKIAFIFAVVILVIMFVLIILPKIPVERQPTGPLICRTKLKGLGVAMQIYAHEYNEKYPTPNNWCDLLVKYVDTADKMFICKMAKKSGNIKHSHYAMNPNCRLNSPANTVLLFETKGGWNQFGSAEILTTEHHKGEGCNILFNDGTVKFVRKEKQSELKWK